MEDCDTGTFDYFGTFSESGRMDEQFLLQFLCDAYFSGLGGNLWPSDGALPFFGGGDLAVSFSGVDRGFAFVDADTYSVSPVFTGDREKIIAELPSHHSLDFWYCMCGHDAELLFAVSCISDQ